MNEREIQFTFPFNLCFFIETKHSIEKKFRQSASACYPPLIHSIQYNHIFFSCQLHAIWFEQKYNFETVSSYAKVHAKTRILLAMQAASELVLCV